MVLAKEKNDDRAMEYFIRSVHKYPMNWGCWLEMTSLIPRVEDVSSLVSQKILFADNSSSTKYQLIALST